MREPKANTLLHEITHKKYNDMSKEDLEQFKADLNDISDKFGKLSIFTESKKTVWKNEGRGYDIFPTPYSNISHSEYIAEVVENIMMCYWYGKGELVNRKVLSQMNHEKFSQVLSLLEKKSYIPHRVGKFMSAYCNNQEFRTLCLNYLWPHSSLGTYSEGDISFLPEIYKDMKGFSDEDLAKMRTLELQKKSLPFMMSYNKKIPLIEFKRDTRGYGSDYQYTNWESYKKKMVIYKVDHLAPFVSFSELKQHSLPNKIKRNIEGLGKAHVGLESLYNLVTMSQKEIIRSKIVVTPDQMDALLRYLPKDTENYLLKLGEKYHTMLPQLVKTYEGRSIREDALLQQHIDLYNQTLVYYTQGKIETFPEFSLKNFIHEKQDKVEQFFDLSKQEYGFLTRKIKEKCLKKYPGIFNK